MKLIGWNSKTPMVKSNHRNTVELNSVQGLLRNKRKIHVSMLHRIHTAQVLIKPAIRGNLHVCSSPHVD